jgi:hypothetical protein
MFPSRPNSPPNQERDSELTRRRRGGRAGPTGVAAPSSCREFDRAIVSCQRSPHTSKRSSKAERSPRGGGIFSWRASAS